MASCGTNTLTASTLPTFLNDSYYSELSVTTKQVYQERVGIVNPTIPCGC